jgi:hypothetical protein
MFYQISSIFSLYWNLSISYHNLHLMFTILSFQNQFPNISKHISQTRYNIFLHVNVSTRWIIISLCVRSVVDLSVDYYHIWFYVDSRRYNVEIFQRKLYRKWKQRCLQTASTVGWCLYKASCPFSSSPVYAYRDVYHTMLTLQLSTRPSPRAHPAFSNALTPTQPQLKDVYSRRRMSDHVIYTQSVSYQLLRSR